jgi:hypothetical protein
MSTTVEIILIVLTLAVVVVFSRACAVVDERSKQCTEKGGVYVKTNDRFECIEAKRVQL